MPQLEIWMAQFAQIRSRRASRRVRNVPTGKLMATNQQQQPGTNRYGPGNENAQEAESQLFAELEINRQGESPCPAATYRNEPVDGDIQLTGETCHATIRTPGEQSSTQVLTSSVDETCTCNVVCQPGITPSDLRIEDGSLVINAFIDSRETLLDLSEWLRQSEDEWHLRRLMTVTEYSTSESDTTGDLLEAVSLTEKQREIVQMAVAKGYYANPRDASLSDLAEEVGVTRSALSQRLNAVEAKLIDTLAAKL